MRNINFLVFSVVVLTAGAQPVGEDNLLEWNPFYTLDWHDFEATPATQSRGDAATAIQITARPFIVRNDVQYDVTAFFNRSRSWVRDPSPSLLAHERLHFDIAELYARKIRKTIREMSRRGVNEVSTYNEAINQLLEESNRVDRQYDTETLHGALSKKQASWAHRISAELERLESYRKQKRIIGSR